MHLRTAGLFELDSDLGRDPIDPPSLIYAGWMGGGGGSAVSLARRRRRTTLTNTS